MKRPTLIFLSTVALIGPLTALAVERPLTAGAEPAPELRMVIMRFADIIELLIPVCVGLALIYFIYGLGQYILESGNEAKKVDGRTRMVWGTAAMFFIVSIWGIVLFIQKTVGVGDIDTINAPGLMR